MTIEALIIRYGLLAILIGAGVEGEAIVLTGGLLAHEGLMPLAGVMAAAALGSFVADQMFFLIGRRFRDHPRVQRFVGKAAFVRALDLLGRYPVGFVFAFRFLYGLRTISPVAIGTSAVRARTFVLLNALAAMLWSVVIAGLGYGFGHGIEMIFGRWRHIGHIAMAVAALIVVVAVTGWLLRRLVRADPAGGSQRTERDT